MARKPSSDRERAARARLKERFDAELRACGEFFAGLDRRGELLEQLADVDAAQEAAVARIVEATGVERAAELVDWSKTKVREAVKASRDSAGGRVDTEAEVS